MKKGKVYQMKYVIIGNSAAAVGCIEGIREKDKKGSITVVSNEIHHTYSRPLISYLLYGKTLHFRQRHNQHPQYPRNEGREYPVLKGHR